MSVVDRAAAPPAPGRLGEAIAVGELLAYLDALGSWRAARRRELDRIDEAALRAQDADTYTGDLTLAMTLWQSITERLAELTRIWDSGRAGPREREQMSRLIWGTGAGAPTAGLGLSLVEACRLCDALTAALRARLAFDPVAADLAARLAATRASLQRSIEQVQASAAARSGEGADLEGMRRRLDELAAGARAGSDISGPFAVLEAGAARAERDLIVNAATRRDLGRDFRATLERRRELEQQEQQLRELVVRVVEKVSPTPKLAVPDVERLGPVPQTRAELDAYRARQERVAAALEVARSAYAGALAERDELRGRLLAFAAKATATGRAGEAVVAAAYDRARTVLWSAPCPLPQARELVAAYQRTLNTVAGGGTT